MDNANIHKAKILKSLYQHINIFYNAPYSPFMNPIEEFFGYLKNKIRKINYKNRHELIKITNQICNTVKPK